MSTIIKRCDHDEDQRRTCRHSWVLRYRDPARGGKLREQSFPSYAKSEARDAQADADKTWREFRRTGRAPMPAEPFGDYAARFIAREGLSANTRRAYRIILHKHLAPLADRDVADVARDRRGAEDLLKGLSDSLGDSSRVQVQRFLVAVMNAAILDRLISEHDLKKLAILPPGYRRVMPAEIAWVTPENFAKVRAALPGSLQLTMDLAAGCGLRCSEALGVRLDDFRDGYQTLRLIRQVDTGSRTMPLKHKKPGEFRDVPVPASVAQRVREHVRDYGAKDGILFRGDRNTYIRASSFTNPWHAARDAAGLAGIRLHDLRHFYASRLLAEGRNLAEVARYLGHSDMTITAKVYVHFLPADGAEPPGAIMDRWFAA